MKTALFTAMLLLSVTIVAQHNGIRFSPLNIPPGEPDRESGSEFMHRINNLVPAEREKEIFNSLASGNMPYFLRNMVTITSDFADAEGIMHKVVFQVMPDYLAVGTDADFCRIPMDPRTAQRLASLFGASLITARLSDYLYRVADIRLTPFNYIPEGNANESVSKFAEHNKQIEMQLSESGGRPGQLIAGIKKDVILSARIAEQPGKVVIYGWHKPGGKPIQPVYSGHVNWYVDYSHGIRLMNNHLIIDGKNALLSDILKDPVLYRLFSNEDKPMKISTYPER
jgi:hypothetical protein